MGENCGVYKITCLANNKIYIGSSSNILKRWSNHRYELRHDTHSNRYLQNAWNKYGEDSFKFEVVELCNPSYRFELEQKYLDKLQPFAEINNGFNILKLTTEQIYKSNIEFLDYDDIGLPHKIRERNCCLEMPVTFDDLSKSKKELQIEYDGYVAMMDLHDDMLMCNPDYD